MSAAASASDGRIEPFEVRQARWGRSRRTELAKVLHDHDEGLVEFVLAEEERFTIRRKCRDGERTITVSISSGPGVGNRRPSFLFGLSANDPLVLSIVPFIVVFVILQIRIKT
jgi:hypothetical protein